jgi:predicted polyphosphate/ATP-dependent NAD kinase
MRVIVCGGRDYRDHQTVDAVLSSLPITQLATGCAQGADRLARQWANRKRIPYRVFRAEWKELGRKAGPIRNQQMLDTFRADALIAFPGGKGTADMVRRARKADLPVLEVLKKPARARTPRHRRNVVKT